MSADSAKGFDRYQVEQCLAERHTAVVYSARDTLLDRVVALKCPRAGLIAEKTPISRCVRTGSALPRSS
jgi:hypothetical protein